MFFQDSKGFSMLCSSLLEPEQATWFLINTGFLEAVRQQHQHQESSWHKVCGVCQSPAFSAFNIAKQTLFVDLNFGEDGNCEEDGSLTVVTVSHVHVFPFFSTGDRHELDCCMNTTSIGKTGKTLTSTGDISAYILPAWQSFNNALLMLARTGTGNVIPDKYRIPGSRQTAASAPRIFLTQGLRRLPKSSFLSFQHCEADTLRWSELWRGWKLWRGWSRMVLSQWSQSDTCMCSLSSVLVIDMNWIVAWTPHQLARLARHWTSTGACILPARLKLFNALLILARNRNRQHDSR